MLIEQAISEILQRNLSSFSKVNNGVLMDCTHPCLLDELENIRGFSTSISEYCAYPSDQIEVGILPESAEPMDCLILVMPKSKEMLKLILSWARYALVEQARVFLVGPKKSGVESGAKQLKVIGENPVKLDSARHCQLWEVLLEAENRLNHFSLSDWESEYYVANPRAEVKTEKLDGNNTEDGNGKLAITTLPGVFSEKRLDAGTALLLETITKDGVIAKLGSAPKSILDFACGSGVISVALGKFLPDAALFSLDNSALATCCTQFSLERNGLASEVYLSNGFDQIPESLRFDLVISNPPFHTGTKTNYAIVERFVSEVKARLNHRGKLVLVSNRFLRYGSLLSEHFNDVQVLSENTAYSVHLASI